MYSAWLFSSCATPKRSKNREARRLRVHPVFLSSFVWACTELRSCRDYGTEVLKTLLLFTDPSWNGWPYAVIPIQTESFPQISPDTGVVRCQERTVSVVSALCTGGEREADTIFNFGGTMAVKRHP